MTNPAENDKGEKMLNEVPTLKPIVPSIFTRIKELIAEEDEKLAQSFGQSEKPESSVITYVFKDENETQYALTLFPKADPRFAIREQFGRTWSAPIPFIRKEVS